ALRFARSKIRERHTKAPADHCIHLVHLTRESVRRQPFRHRVGIKKRTIDFLRRSAQDTVKLDGVCGHGLVVITRNCIAVRQLFVCRPSVLLEMVKQKPSWIAHLWSHDLLTRKCSAYFCSWSSSDAI